MDESYWQLIAFGYPPFDKPVLVTDGKSCRIYILRIKHKMKFWESLSSDNSAYYPTHWTYLPALPE